MTKENALTNSNSMTIYWDGRLESVAPSRQSPVMAKKIRMGFIGVGSMGYSHLELFHQQCAKQAEAVALCASNTERLRRAQKIAPDTELFKNELALIKSDLDAVVISSPNFTHVPLALEAIKAGKHVFLEKPVGVTPAECRKLLRASQKSDRILMIGHELRYSPYFAKIKQLIDKGAVGVPQMAWCKEFRGPFQPKSRNWIQDRRKSGGCLVDKNCHHFDLMNWWLNSRPKRVSAFGSNAINRVISGPNQVHDHATANWEYSNGAKGTLHLSLFAHEPPKETLEMGVVGLEGVLQTDLDNLKLLHWAKGKRKGEPKVVRVNAKRGIGWGGHLGFAEMHPAFIKAIRTGVQPLTSVENTIDGTLLAIAAEQSIREKKIIKIN
jgi:predicted dehydrogenase